MWLSWPDKWIKIAEKNVRPTWENRGDCQGASIGLKTKEGVFKPIDAP